jgi:hypothetical protein
MKKEYGQFYTTNYEKILQKLCIPENVELIEPFAGDGDLVRFCNGEIECYDIEPKQSYIQQRDTLLSPPNYNNKFVITNPPYLAKNKNKLQQNSLYYKKYDTDDLYKCFLKTIIQSSPIGGVLIIPLNFWCSIRYKDIELRREFLSKYEIIHLNIFNERVFDDTSYNVCSFSFKRRESGENIISTTFYPMDKNIQIKLNTKNLLIGGEIYELPISKDFKITRLTKNNTNEKGITNIFVRCIDKNSKERIECVMSDKLFIDETPNLTARTFATLVIQPEISIEKQHELCNSFNEYLNKMRDEYNSLFLTNYRDKGRKRISFSLVYRIVNYLLL